MPLISHDIELDEDHDEDDVISWRKYNIILSGQIVAVVYTKRTMRPLKVELEYI